MTLFKNKYRIPSARLQTFNYASQGMYFVTICTKFMQHYFGKIINESKTNKARLDPTEIGKIAESEWYKSLELRPDMNLDIGEFIVMPNHIHGIIIIGKNEYNSGGNIGKLNGNSKSCGSTDAMHRVSTQSAFPTQSASPFPTQSTSQNAFEPQTKNLASIILGYKSAVTTFARKNNIRFEWHVRYHDHIIRNEEEYLRISNYIKNNPSKWLQDKFNNSK